jgi:hypothetical protein
LGLLLRPDDQQYLPLALLRLEPPRVQQVLAQPQELPLVQEHYSLAYLVHRAQHGCENHLPQPQFPKGLTYPEVQRAL